LNIFSQNCLNFFTLIDRYRVVLYSKNVKLIQVYKYKKEIHIIALHNGIRLGVYSRTYDPKGKLNRVLWSRFMRCPLENLLEPVHRALWISSQAILIVNIVESKSNCKANVPFKVVHERPCKVALYGGAIPASK